jgi:hypothetical protein
MPRNSDGHRRSVRQEHGPGDFYYSDLPDLQPHPVMRCLCGETPEKMVSSWEEAGRWLDEHIFAALRKDAIRWAEYLRKNPAPAPAAEVTKGRTK